MDFRKRVYQMWNVIMTRPIIEGWSIDEMKYFEV